jgi:nucleotide-binding universal stress UspA family protein
MTRILIATGGGPHSDKAVQFSTQFAARATLSILTVINNEQDRPRAESILAKAGASLEAHQTRLNTRIRLGHPAEEIILEAEEGRYDLLIAGDREHHRLMTRFFLGSTAQRVVEHAPCPVIIAKGLINPVRSILLCDSGIQSPSLVGRFTSQVGSLLDNGQQVTVLHVMSQISAGPGVKGQHLRAGANQLIAENSPEGELLQRDIQMLARLQVTASAKVRHGLVVDEILAEVHDAPCDLVVIGTNRGQGWRRILLDDLAHQIIAGVNRPVLVVR